MERSQKPSIVKHRDFPFVLLGFLVAAGFLIASGWFQFDTTNNLYQLDDANFTDFYRKLPGESTFAAIALIPAAAISLGSLGVRRRKYLWVLPLGLTFLVFIPALIGFVEHENHQQSIDDDYAPTRAALAHIFVKREPAAVMENQLSDSGVQWVQAVQTLPGDQAAVDCADLKVAVASYFGQPAKADAAISCRYQAKVDGIPVDAYVKYEFAGTVNSTTQIVYVANLPADANTSTFTPDAK